MNQAIADPEQLRRFAGHLRAYAEELKQRNTALASHLNELGQTWRDEQQRKFAQEFEDQMRQMTRLLNATEQHVPYLLRKADQIETYLRG
ncbi:WXG100 family type VII secretion target [Roseimaritima sediminicola]|uniref:WXG100 family type VII secretion target n=1 Tax=Roseimaritima sediminicola TaxID=2662066 RepID=UPI001298490E|nr:WXG100 family type VII secretion target [Roseimaritima sediminicola]